MARKAFDASSWPLLLLLVACRSGAVTVETSFGKVVGHRALSGDLHECHEFLGIPFAEPPARFSPPAAWTKPYGQGGWSARQYGAYCPQLDGDRVGGDEDCLYLNIWRPASTTPNDRLTVLAWIYGGGFTIGDGGDRTGPNTYDGCGLAARHSLVVVTMNYRLGPLGFASFRTNGGRVHANWGAEDQREALRWVQAQVAHFGGSPDKVTIFGESAGAISVFHHVASPRSRGLFRAAISESGFPSAESTDFGVNRTRNFAHQVGCTDDADLLACLRSKPTEILIRTADDEHNPLASPGWGPVVDGVDLPDFPQRLIAENRSNPVPLLAGTNTDEGTVFIWPLYPKGMNESAYRDLVVKALSNFNASGPQLPHDPVVALNATALQKVFERYQSDSLPDRRLVASALFTDAAFLCGTLNAARLHARHADVFVYRFDYRPRCPKPGQTPGVYHGLEMPYVFGTPRSYDCEFDSEERAFSRRIQSMWSSFAKLLDPGAATGERWPKFGSPSAGGSPGAGAGGGLVLRPSGDVVEEDYRADYCRLWAALRPTWPAKGAPEMSAVYV